MVECGFLRSCRVPHKAAGVLLGGTLSLQADNDTLAVEEPQVVGVTIDHGHTHEGGRKLVGAEHHGNVCAVVRGRARARVVVLSQTEGQVVIVREVATVVPLGVVVELHRRKVSHDVRLTFNRYPLPRNIGGAIEAHHGDQASLECLADEGTDLAHKLSHEGLAVLKIPLCLGDARRLDITEGTHTSLIQAGLAAALASHRADLIPGLVGGREVEDSGHITAALTLDGLGIGVDVQQLHIRLLGRPAP